MSISIHPCYREYEEDGWCKIESGSIREVDEQYQTNFGDIINYRKKKYQKREKKNVKKIFLLMKLTMKENILVNQKSINVDFNVSNANIIVLRKRAMKMIIIL